jgi:xanthine dehydrogenase accessory factor
MDVPLGPEIGQCCGGRVALTLERLDAAGGRSAAGARPGPPRRAARGADPRGRPRRPGARRGARPLPVRPLLIDGRAEPSSPSAPAGVETRLAALPEAEIAAARPGSAFVVLTHDHALDFLLAREALGRGDAAYVGMIGSASKRAKFVPFSR